MRQAALLVVDDIGVGPVFGGVRPAAVLAVAGSGGVNDLFVPGEDDYVLPIVLVAGTPGAMSSLVLLEIVFVPNDSPLELICSLKCTIQSLIA